MSLLSGCASPSPIGIVHSSRIHTQLMDSFEHHGGHCGLQSLQRRRYVLVVQAVVVVDPSDDQHSREARKEEACMR